MVVYNPDIFWTGIYPVEANSILIANPDAVLPFPIAGKLFQAITWRDSKINELR